MHVLIVFPEVPRAVFNTALGWYGACRDDPDVSRVLAANSRGLYGVLQDCPLENVASMTRNPDITLVIRGYQIHDLRLGSHLPGQKRALILTDEPYETDRTIEFNTGAFEDTYDVVAVNDSSVVDRHSRGFYLPCASDEFVKVPSVDAKWDICYVGTADKRREQWLREIDRANRGASWCLVGPKWKPKRWNKAASHYQRVKMSHTPGSGYLSPEDVACLYASSRLVLNIHRRGDANSPNPRTYDGIVYGLPILQDARRDTPKSVLQFADPGSMASFSRGYLQNEAGCVDKVKASVTEGLEIRGQHTYSARWREIVRILAD
ncbi:MAG: glycosyltransferase family 1 protein [Armatimonadetes bacterium]|nr:glycosyltransferase family 1 protein [Armatimonadota bacterium]